ncbi:MAG: endopeptidase La, partial [Clostridiales bacterium]|nr:endopeptidase La [Clostridiales bacterium]
MTSTENLENPVSVAEQDASLSDKKTQDLPLAPMRGVVLFPGAMISFDLGRGRSIGALEEALEQESAIFLTAQRDREQENPEPSDLYPHGTVARVLQVLRLPGGLIRVIAQGAERGAIENFMQEDPFMKVRVALAVPEPAPPEEEQATDAPTSQKAMLRLAQEQFMAYAGLYGKISPDVLFEAADCSVASQMADLIGTHIPMKTEQQQTLLEEWDGEARLTKAIDILAYELEILEMQKGLYEKIKGSLDKNQRDYILKEQLKAIQEELGDTENDDGEIAVYRQKIADAHLPAHVEEKLQRELKRLERSASVSPDAAMQRDYIERVLELPWSFKTKENLSLKRASAALEKDHFGLEKVKERIIEFLAVRQNAAALDAPILCLTGPPGVGKTSIAKSVARALNRKYVRVSLGGIRDEADIRGHRKTYIGAMPGRVIDAVRQAGSLNPLILLDEIDKMGADYRGNPAAALLEVLDAEQNSAFRDHYLELNFDLSDVLFICTANTLDSVPQPLIDRLEILELTSYTQDEKRHIATDFLIPKQFKKHGLRKSQLKLSADVLEDIIQHFTREAGVRQLERLIGALCRKTVKLILTEDRKSVSVTPENITSFLGKKKYRTHPVHESAEVGVCRGLAWTMAGGDTLSIEVNTMKGVGRFKLTGNAGKVMEESAQAAVSFIRSHSDQ